MIAYLYGIIECNQGDALGISGVDGISPVSVVVHDGLGCVVSDYRGEYLFSLSKYNLIRSLLAHQLVVECAMGHHPVLPVKFGTTLDSTQDALDLLTQGHRKFRNALAAIRDKIEVEVAATWDTPRVLQGLSTEEEVIRARDALTRGGNPTVEERVKLGQVVKACMDRRRASYQERMVSFLKPAVLDMVPNLLLSDEMVMNVAFLVERIRQQEFDDLIQNLDQLFQNEITFRVVGPLPPYSFSTVEITRLTPEQLEAARRILHLGEVISEPEVRRAYRSLAAQAARKTSALSNPDSVGSRINAQTAPLKQASELLLGYCHARSEAREGEGSPGLSAQEMGSPFAITVKRSGGDGEVESARFGGSMGK